MRSRCTRIMVLVIGMMLLNTVTGCGSNEVTEGLSVIETVEHEEEQEANTEETAKGEEVEKEAEKEAEVILVYVCGAVQTPGVYELKDGSRIVDAIKAAGGMTELAHPSYLNQAQVLLDGDRVCVLTAEEVTQGGDDSIGVGEDTKADNGGKVNINQASKEELMELTGIGEAKAESILQYREEKGGFKTIEAIMEIEGIKEGVYNKIKDEISVN